MEQCVHDFDNAKELIGISALFVLYHLVCALNYLYFFVLQFINICQLLFVVSFHKNGFDPNLILISLASQLVFLGKGKILYKV